MATLETSSAIYEEKAKLAMQQGMTATQFAEQLRSAAEEVKTIQQRTQMEALGVSPEFLSQEEQVTMATEEMTEETREALQSVMDATGTPHTAREAEEIGEELQDAARTVDTTLGESDAQAKALLEEGAAGQAFLDEPGTETFDPRSIMGSTTLVDQQFALGLGAHETFHTHQKAPDAAEAQIGTSTITTHDFIEVGAIAEQIDAAPESFDQLSEDYQALYHKVIDVMPDVEHVKELSKEGKFQQFAFEAALQNNVVETSSVEQI